MIGLDTNVLIRYLTQDDPSQSPIATAFIEERLTEEEPGFISLVALVETAWVLDRVYRFSAAEIAAAMERMIRVATFVVERERLVFAAVQAFRAGAGDFGDILIALCGSEAGCSRTVTFDRKALRVAGFSALMN